MEYELASSRHALEVLAGRPAWRELEDVIAAITPDDIIETQRTIAQVKRRWPKGGQTALNAIFASRLRAWTPEPRLFRSAELREWKMDFLKERVGVEISFNHAEAIAWQLTRLTIAGESPRVVPESQIDVGVVIVATRSLKAWARMDSAVGTFDVFQAWIREMRPILPIPLLLVGLRSDGWAATDVFPGTGATRAVD